MSKHEKFILTSISTEIEKAISATEGIGDGIETYPLNEYMLHSLFLKMTGFQEQKMKCIAWEMGTEDFEFRRKLLYDLKLGEYSNFEAKNKIYLSLITIINKNSNSFSIFEEKEEYKKVKDDLDNKLKAKKSKEDAKNKKNQKMKTEKIENEIKDLEKEIEDKNTEIKILENKIKELEDKSKIMEISNLSFNKTKELFENKVFAIWNQKKYDYFCRNGLNDFDYLNLLNKKEFISNKLKSFYENDLYNQRNRLAHNTLSYQENLPSLKTLVNEDDSSRNYFRYFATLILIDNIFIYLYKEFRRTLDECNY